MKSLDHHGRQSSRDLTKVRRGLKKKSQLSPRLKGIVDALPLRNGMRVLEIGCGTGAAARAIIQRLPNVYVLAIDRSEKSIRAAITHSQEAIATGRLCFRQAAIEEFVLKKGEPPFDVAFAVRVGALDGRHPEIEQAALQRIAGALTPKGKLFIDGKDASARV